MDRGKAQALAQQAAGLYRARRFAEALPLLERLHRAAPDSPNITYRLARCLQALDRIDDACELAQELVVAGDERGPKLLAKLTAQEPPTESTLDTARDETTVADEARDYITLLADEPGEGMLDHLKKRGVRKQFRKLLEETPTIVPLILDDAYLDDSRGAAVGEILTFLRAHEDLGPQLDDVARRSDGAYVWRALGWRTLRGPGDVKPERRSPNIMARCIGLGCPHREIRDRIARDIKGDAPAVLDLHVPEYTRAFDAALKQGGGREVILALGQHAFGEFAQSKIPRIKAVLGIDHLTEVDEKFADYEANAILDAEKNPEFLGFKGMFNDAAQYLLWKIARGDYGESVQKQLAILRTSTTSADLEEIYSRLTRR